MDFDEEYTPAWKKGMWQNDQQWRDQLICQTVYLRSAIYYVGFIIAACSFAFGFLFIDLYDEYISKQARQSIAGGSLIVIITNAIFMAYRAHKKAEFMENRQFEMDYDLD